MPAKFSSYTVYRDPTAVNGLELDAYGTNGTRFAVPQRGMLPILTAAFSSLSPPAAQSLPMVSRPTTHSPVQPAVLPLVLPQTALLPATASTQAVGAPPTRFRTPLSDLEFNQLAVPFVAKSTQSNTTWVVKERAGLHTCCRGY